MKSILVSPVGAHPDIAFSSLPVSQSRTLLNRLRGYSCKDESLFSGVDRDKKAIAFMGNYARFLEQLHRGPDNVCDVKPN